MPYHQEFMETEIKRVRTKISETIYNKLGELNAVMYKTKEPLRFENRLQGEKSEVKIGETWGNNWDCAWFNFTGKVPAEAKGKKVVLMIDVNGEACVFGDDGCPLEGLTSIEQFYPDWLGSPGKTIYPITENSNGDEDINIWVDCASNDLFGGYIGDGKLKEAYIATCCVPLRDLSYDFEVLWELYELIPKEKARKHVIFRAMYEAALAMKEYNAECALAAREILKPVFEAEGCDQSLKITAIGHAHLDLAWGWPIRETIRKGARTFSTVVANMKRYPDYVFGASQPQLYVWMKNCYPKLYEKVKELVRQGRWEVQGAMWVESDTNVPNGESLIRQVMYGKRFFMDEFGEDIKTLWLPDVFGYSGALPQILKKSGVDYFMTTKIAGNRYNKMPHSTFIWEGIDGTGILAHMPPEAYNSSAAPHAFLKAEEDFMDKGLCDECLVLYGIGDGGGGPGEPHMERLLREKNLCGMPPVKQEKSIEFFRRIDKNIERYPKWVGELYFERHQGTYTSEARNKRYNRLMEQAFHTLELLESTLGTRIIEKDRVDEIWKEFLLYQFHDILPGSSIERVYRESCERYGILYKEVTDAIAKAQQMLAEQTDTAGMTKPAVVFNSLPWDRSGWVRIGDDWKYVTVPSLGFASCDMALHDEPEQLTIDGNTMSNGFLTVTFADDGSITSIVHPETGEVLAAPANRFAIYNDAQSLGSDAWDFPITVREREIRYAKLVSSEMYIDGPRVICSQKYEYEKSTIQQDIILTDGSRRVDFKTHLVWNEQSKMLRTAFPVNVYSTNLNCDIQFGYLGRPTTANTSWEAAKYEVCAHKWADLSQTDKGVAMLSDCKYGYTATTNSIDINLLRSAEGPDEHADQGEHDLTYSLYPHAGNHISADVNCEGYDLNIPMTGILVDAHAGKASNWSFATTDAPNAIIETIKKAEDSDDIIIRIYESDGGCACTTLDLGFDVERACLTDLMENEIGELDASNIVLNMKPFEICTVKISPKGKAF